MNLIPYQSLPAQRYTGTKTIKISQNDFAGVDYDGTHTTFSFHNCIFDELIIENEENIDFEKILISFMGCYINHIRVENIKTENVSLYFGNSFISGRIASDNIESIQVNNTLTSGLFLLNQKNVHLSFSKENIFTDVWPKLIKAAYRGNIIQLWEKRNAFYVHDTQVITFDSNFTQNLWRELLPTLYSKCLDDPLFTLIPGHHQIIGVSLSIVYSTEVERTRIKVSSLSLNALSIEGDIKGKLNIENSFIDNLYINKLSVSGEATFFNIRPLKKDTKGNNIEIKQSNLDNVSFDNIPFIDYKIVSFYRTKLAKAKFTSCTFPTTYTSFSTFQTLENVHYLDTKSDSYYKDQYENFLQLKSALESSGNFYESQKLQSVSNDALMQIEGISKWDKFILWSNAKSNNHGLSIKQPLLYFFSFTILFYLFYLLSLGYIHAGGSIDFTLAGYYFSFIDPTHRLDFLVTKDKYNFLSIFFDFINKIASGYFIYQFVAAFRKYGKK